MRKMVERLWLLTLLLLAHCIISTGCAHGVAAHAINGPDLSGVISISTKTGFAHICPIGPHLALTSGHVVDPRPWDPDAPMMGGYGDSELAVVGMIAPDHTYSSRDLAVVRSEVEFPHFFAVAKDAPHAGVPLYLLGFDYKDSRHLLSEKRHEMGLLRIVGRTLVMDGDSQPGSSGGCVVNALGEVVGITEGWISDEQGNKSTLAVGVWGEEFGLADQPEEPAAEELTPVS